MLSVCAVAALAAGCAALHPPVHGATPAVSAKPEAVASGIQLDAPSTDVVWALLGGDQLFLSLDRGDSWKQRSLPPQIGANPTIAFIDDHQGWLLAPSAPIGRCEAQLAELWHTTDAGLSWQDLGARIDKTQCKNSMWFFDPTHGFVSAWDQLQRPTVFRTTDAGDHWVAATLADPAYFKSAPGFTLQVSWMKRFGGALYLLAHGSQPPDLPKANQFVLRSTDGGASWSYLTKVASPGVVMVSESRWLDFAAPGQAMESVNGGQQFHPFASDLNLAGDVDGSQFLFADDIVGYVAQAGRLQRTVDGGVHWAQLRLPGQARPVPWTPTPTVASSTRTGSRCLSSLPPAGTWPTYSNAQYGFAISYPSGFRLGEEGSAMASAGWLDEWRAVDSCYLDTYPAGQVEMGVYKRDADTPADWVQKNSAASCSSGAWFRQVVNEKPATVAGRDAVTFDAGGCGAVATSVHETVLFLGPGDVFRFDWWSADAAYTPTIQAIAAEMLASLQG